jgi:DNA-binding CsgD family transcriptional regulator
MADHTEIVQDPAAGAGAESIGLLERDAELAALDGALAAARAGDGAAVIVEGPSGIGKTSVLGAARRLAGDAGMQVLAGRATEVEREVGWGLVRELFVGQLAARTGRSAERALTGAARFSLPVLGIETVSGGEEDAADATALALQGLYWLTANLATETPLLIVVDDVQWCDSPSLRWLAHLAARLSELACLLLVAGNIPWGEGEDYVDALAGASTPLVLLPLGEASTARLVRERLGAHAEDEFCAACHRATAGRPLLVRELISELRRERIRPDVAGVARLSDATPASVARGVHLRVARLGEDARSFAAALSVVGGEATVAEVASVAGMSGEAGRAAAEALAAADLLMPQLPLDLVHPMARAAVYADLSATRRADLHARAAAVLSRRGAEPSRIATHLLQVEPAADPAVWEVLMAAARDALAQGAPDGAVSYLRRALREPPPEAERVSVLRELGRAEASGGDPAAAEHFAAAQALVSDQRQRAELAVEVGRSLLVAGRLAEACDALEDALNVLDPADRDLRPRLQAEFLEAALYGADTAARGLELVEVLEPPDPAETEGERLLVARLAFHEAGIGSAGRVAELASRALAAGPLLEDEAAGSQAAFVAADALMLCDRLDEAEEQYNRALAAARARSSTRGVAFALLERSHLNYRRGDLAESESDARVTLNALELAGWWWGMPIPLAFLVEALVEQGRLAEARDLVAQGWVERASRRSDRPAARLLHARGRLRAAAGDLPGGLDDLQRCGRILTALRVDNPAALAWRTNASQALVALGRREEADELARDELRYARRLGTPRAIGMSTRACGLSTTGPRGIELLREAVTMLEASTARLEHARALVDLGAAVRRSGLRREARQELAAALDLASRLGARALAQRAREEIAAAGGRLRRERISGPDGLTGSERRVARMAADGLTNRQIAEALFVSLRTVETHLTHAYQKLDIGSRDELATTLGAR